MAISNESQAHLHARLLADVRLIRDWVQSNRDKVQRHDSPEALLVLQSYEIVIFALGQISNKALMAIAEKNG